MPQKDYYAVLNIPKNASEDDVKRAYRKMAVKWHPDKNPDNVEEASNKFKEIAEAYEVLSDPEKRRVFDSGVDPNDQFAAQAGRRTSTSHAFRARDPFELFNMFFGDQDPFADFFGDSFSPFRRASSGATMAGAGNSGRTSLFGRSLFDDDDFLGRFSTMGLSGLSRTGAGSGNNLTSPASRGTQINIGGSLHTPMAAPTGDGRATSLGRTVTTTTKVVNGQKVVTKVTRTTHSDGTVEETVEESTQGQSATPTSRVPGSRLGNSGSAANQGVRRIY